MPKAKPQSIVSGARLQRDFAIAQDAIDSEARTAVLAFSSEAPVERPWGIEILDHSAGAVRLDRIRTAGPLLINHDTDDQIGVVESVQIGADRVGRAVVRFGKSAAADEIFNDVIDGIRRSVSVAYIVHAWEQTSGGDQGDVYRITDWEPFEVSLVSVPADTSVGVGRSADSGEAPPSSSTPSRTEEPVMSEQNAQAVPAATNGEPANVADIEARTRASEQRRINEIIAIGEQFRSLGVDRIAIDAVRNGTSVEQFRQAAMERIASAPRPTADIGLSQRETQQYSLLRVLHAMANPTDTRAREAAAFELECSRAAADRQGREVKGVVVPHDVLRRELNVGTPTAGGNLVATNLMAGDFITLLRNAMVLDGLGMRMMTGLVGNIAIPRLTGGATAYWVDESAAPTASQQAFDQVAMSPKTLGARTPISRKLLLQNSLDAEALVRNDLATVLALELQRAAINGSGTAPEPRGILNVSGIGAVVGGTNGAAPTWGNVIELETDVSVANADIGSLAYLTNAKVRGKLKSTEQFATTNGRPVWQDGNTPLNGYRAGVTNAVPSNLTKGTSSGVCSAIIFGNWADLITGLWGGLELQVDPYSSGDTGSVVVRVFQDADVAVRHAQSFSAMVDALTA